MTNTQFNTQKNTVAGTSTLPRTKYPGSPLLEKGTVQSPIARTAAGIALPKAFEDYKNKAKANDFIRTLFNHTPQRDIGTELEGVMQLPRTAENVARADVLNSERVAKATADPNLAQYINDDIAQRAEIYTATPGAKADVDYSLYIRQLAQMPVTAQTQKQMRDLLSARDAKIAANPDLSSYANDEVAQLAKQYLSYYAPEKVGSDAYFEKADAIANQNYADAEASLLKQKTAEEENLRRAFDQARRETDLAYAVKSRGQENLLAEQGLGKGLGAGPSSGYSEGARLGALADYSNGINESYAQQADAERELAADYEARRTEAAQNRNAILLQNLYARLQQENTDRQFDLGVHNYNTGIRQQDNADAIQREAFDYQKGQDALSEDWRQKEFTRLLDQDAFEREWNEKLFENENYWNQKNYDLNSRSGGSGGYVVDPNYAAYLAGLYAGGTPQ
jgi:hypothetical protein